MAYVFLDESGDLGFDFRKKGTSRYFVIAALFCRHKRPVERAVIDVHRSLRKKYRVMSGVLHAAGEEEATRVRLCKKLAERDVRLMTVYVDKRQVFARLREEKHVLYNYVANILLGRLVTWRVARRGEDVELIVARRETSSFLNDNFKAYLSDQSSSRGPQLRVRICSPHEEKGLQAVDMACWAMFRKYELDDSRYSRLLQPIVVEENALFG